MSRVLAVDLDGVLVDFNSGFARLLRQINPAIKVDSADAGFPSVWGWPKHYGYSAEDESKAWTEVRHSGVFWASLFPYSSALDDIQYLNTLRKKHDIYFVTSRPGATAKYESEFWLEGHGFKLPTVVICDAKDKFCAAVEADVIIDDKPDNLLNQPSKVQTALFMRPYNEGYWGYFNKTVSSVREALDGL